MSHSYVRMTVLFLITVLSVLLTTPVLSESSSVITVSAEDHLLPNEGGIGGTGVSLNNSEGGIGGTGIIGEITGFGSIIVNGVHIDYDADMVVDGHLAQTIAHDLQIGQVVIVEAQSNNGRYTAQSITLSQPVMGVVSLVDVDQQRLQVMGQTVQIPEESRIAREQLMHLKVGDAIAVSGFWDGDFVQATRLDPYAENAAVISGLVSKDAGGELFIGEMPLRFNATQKPIMIESGMGLTVIGELRASHEFMVSRLVMKAAMPFDGRVRHFIVEGYPNMGPAGLHLGQIRLDGQALELGKRQLISGDRMTDQRMRVRTIMHPPKLLMHKLQSDVPRSVMPKDDKMRGRELWDRLPDGRQPQRFQPHQMRRPDGMQHQPSQDRMELNDVFRRPRRAPH